VIKDKVLEMVESLNHARVIYPTLAPSCDALIELLAPVVIYIDMNGDPTMIGTIDADCS
jgi:hypothetical protein